LAGTFQTSSSAVYLLTQANGTVTLTPWAYLPFVSKNFSFTPFTPTPTNTPVVGCSTAPTLIGPANGSTLNTLIPLFQWDSGNNPNATEFYLEVWLDPELTDWATGLRCTGCRTQGINQWRSMSNLDLATTHYWRTYLMCGSTQGPYSEVWSFTTGSGGTILPGPNLLSPANGSTLAGTVVTLQWSPVSGAAEYLVHFVAGSAHNVRAVGGTETTITWLSPNTTYEWWVQARNDYAWGTDSTHWQFTTGASGSSIQLNPSYSLPPLRDHIVVESNGTTIVFEEQDTR
jgi:hypothetical protein